MKLQDITLLRKKLLSTDYYSNYYEHQKHYKFDERIKRERQCTIASGIEVPLFIFSSNSQMDNETLGTQKNRRA